MFKKLLIPLVYLFLVQLSPVVLAKQTVQRASRPAWVTDVNVGH